MGMAHSQQNRLDAAVAAYKRVIRLRPRHYAAYMNLGNALLQLNRLDEAVACMEQSIRLKPDSASAHTNLGLVLLLQGRCERGWEEYQWRWKTEAVKPPQFECPRWDGTPLTGKTILLVHEQGLGDTVQFVRYAVQLQERWDCRVLVRCQQALLPLLRTCSGIDELISTKAELPDFDVFAPLLDLPRLLRQEQADFPTATPYLSADASLVRHWGPKHKSDAKRSIELRQFAPLGQLQGVRFFSLQKGAGAEQLETLGGIWMSSIGAMRSTARPALLRIRPLFCKISICWSASIRWWRTWPGRCRCPPGWLWHKYPTGVGGWEATRRHGTRHCGCSASSRPALGTGCWPR
ncbi:MAG: tetratricopeptide repeat protein [Candidatus Latescibacteria bacterium]|nr:tetratricopeptide repeat protein [Candidatus Latescibacterota bacterium]